MAGRDTAPPPPPAAGDAGWQMPAQAEAPEHRFPCPNCGSEMRFAPGSEQLICDHCGHAEQITRRADAPVLAEQDFEAALSRRLPQAEIEETRNIRCPNCGAETAFGPDTDASTCPFCATPLVDAPAPHRHVKPAGLLPFTLDEPAARQAMTEWLGSLWFAPNGLKQYARKGRRMKGVYVPYWTFDAQTESDYRGQRGRIHYETRQVTRNGKTETRRVQRIRWQPVRGRVARFFDDVLVLASSSLPRRHTDALEPWDLSQLRPWNPEYLAGFMAEGYRIDLPDAFPLAREKMDRVIERDIRFDIGGDRQRIDAVQTRVDDVTFKHVLLPVWIAAYRWKGQSFRFVVNAQTGRVQGERPWSRWKIALAVVAGLILAAIFGYFYAQQGG